METDRLKHFCTIIETGSMTKAAELLGFSHSGLSKSISTLESDLKIKLFIPQGRGIIPTQEALNLYQKARPLLGLVSDLYLKDHKHDQKTLRLGVFEIFTAYFSGEIIQKAFKDYKVEILELGPGDIENALAQGRIDIGISYIPVPHQGIEHLKICTIPHNIYIREKAFTNMKFEELPFVVPSVPMPQNPLGVKERDGWPESHYPRHKKYFVNLLSTGLDLVRQGLCGIYIPDYVANMHNEVSDDRFQLKLFKSPASQAEKMKTVYLVKTLNTQESAEVKKLSSAIRTVCK